MSITTTAAERFTSASQFGSGTTWTNVSNLPLGGQATTTNLPGPTNTLRLQVPNGAASIPTGAIFRSMELRFEFRSNQSGGEIRAYATSSLSLGTVATRTVSPATTAVLEADGDKDYWKLTLGTDEIISKIADGSLAFDIYLDVIGLISYPQPNSRLVDNVSLAITYEVIKGREAATIATFL